jgi:SAM-dependent methyltransferase
MDTKINIQAYDSVELLSNFESQKAIEDYRNMRLQRYQHHVEFILKRSGDQSISALEVGSGSSVLLYAIAQRVRILKGTGIELSQSRTLFADQWKKDGGYSMVENVNGNFVDIDMGQSSLDWFIIIDNTFTYLYPEDTQYPILLLEKAFSALKSGGQIVIDFINYAKRKPEIEYKQWSAFLATDPFSYGLYSNKIENGINRSETIFIKRDGSESKKIELCKVYSLEDLTLLLKSKGFTVEEVFESFDEKPFIPESSDRMLVLAKKN